MPSGPGGLLFGYPLNSPLGIAAGPLLNSKWVEGYARLGFDVLTYATVRSQPVSLPRGFQRLIATADIDRTPAGITRSKD